MGWNWAVFRPHSTLQDAFDSKFTEDSVGRIQHVRALPSFDIMQLIYWLYIDDYAGCTLVDRETPAGASKAADYSERAVRRLEDTGLSSHKEMVGEGLEECLGIGIDPVTRVCPVKPEKMRTVAMATGAAVLLDWVKPRTIQILMGHWAWIMIVFRPAFAIPHQVYRWLDQATDIDKPHKLWRSVAAELAAMASLSIFFVADMGAGWYHKVYMTDASNWGYAALSADASPAAQRAEARHCDLQGWGVTADQLYSRVERDADA